MKISERRRERIKTAVAKRQLDLTVVLENLTDGHNIGAILRSCESVGVTSVYLIPHPDSEMRRNFVLGKRTTAGARKWLNVYQSTDIKSCIDHLRNYHDRIYCTGIGKGSASLYELDLTESTAIVMGNEKVGVSEEAIKWSDGLLSIPMQGMVQSLNVSVAAAVILYEAMRQRLDAGCYATQLHPADAKKQELFKEYLKRHGDNYIGRKPERLE